MAEVRGQCTSCPITKVSNKPRRMGEDNRARPQFTKMWRRTLSSYRWSKRSPEGRRRTACRTKRRGCGEVR